MTSDLWLPPGRHVKLPGRGTTFVRDLAGPPGAPTVMLLHGLLATADLNWSGAYATLGEHFRVVALDHRGHGRGIRSPGRFRLADCADDVAALADVLGLSTFVVVGYSMGGPIAQLVWRRHPDRVDGLVLCATSRNFRGHPRERVMFGARPAAGVAVRLMPPAAWRRLAAAAAKRVGDSTETQWKWSEFRRSDPMAMIEAAQALGHYTSHDWISEVDVPTAIVVTRHDRLVPARRQHKLAAAVPGATVYEIDGDHPVGVREPHRFVPVLLEACVDVSGRVAGGWIATDSLSETPILRRQSDPLPASISMPMPTSPSSGGGGVACGPDGDQRREHLFGRREPAEMTLSWSDVELGVRDERHDVLSMGQRHDVVGVAVPPPHGHGDVADREAPRPGEEEEVEDGGGHAPPAPREDVVEKHGFQLWPGEHPAVTFGGDAA